MNQISATALTRRLRYSAGASGTCFTNKFTVTCFTNKAYLNNKTELYSSGIASRPFVHC